jgi:hypothetical protein
MMNPKNDNHAFRVAAPGEAAAPVRTPAELERLARQRKGREAKARRTEAARRRWMLLNAFVDAGMAGLEISDAVVWLALFRNARADGVATVARVRLVEITGLAPNTITTSIGRLVAAGWIERLRRGGPSGGIAVYRLQPLEKVAQ